MFYDIDKDRFYISPAKTRLTMSMNTSYLKKKAALVHSLVEKEIFFQFRLSWESDYERKFY